MGTRLQLQSKLEELLGCKHVYYKPPENLKMEYPAIRYSKSKIESAYANNSAYLFNNRYELVVIDKRPDNPVINKILRLPTASYDRQYDYGNLSHDVITLYF